MLAAAVPKVIVYPFKLVTPLVIVKLLLMVTLLVVMSIAGVIPEVLAIVKLLKTFAVVPAIVCAVEPTNFTPAAEEVVLSVNVPLLVKFPNILSEASEAAARVIEVTGNVLLIIKSLHNAAVPDAIVGILLIPVPLVMVTLVELVGTALLHQLLAVPQLLVKPSHPPELEITETTEVAEVLVHGVEDVI